MFTITLNGETMQADTETEAMAKAETLHKRHGGIPKIDQINSVFGGATIVSDAAKARIEVQHAALQANGIAVDASQQLYATGTRMADVGYATQRTREQEFKTQMPIRAAADALTEMVRAEKRRDILITSGELAQSIEVDSKRGVTLHGYRASELALRGLMPRIDSSALGYLIGLRDRMVANAGDRDARSADASMIADVLRRELTAAPEVELKLRARDGVGDVFACVSPKYACADAPESLMQIAKALPADARGTFSYDPKSTAWQLRANVFTPTPVSEQAVGEAFSGYAALSGRDGGNGSINGSGGVLMLRCLNASTYAAQTENASRVHRGRVLVDVGAIFANAAKAIDALCKVWGVARNVVLEDAPTIEGIKMAREIALAGYFRGMLADKRSEMAQVLPGRTEQHVSTLVDVYGSERRDSKRLVKSDLAQSVTRYAQQFAVPVQRDAEQAIGAWLASDRKPVCDVRAA